MLRVSAVAEKAGVPSASLVCEGFIGQAATTSVGLGVPNLPLSSVPGHVDSQDCDELQRNIVEFTVDQVIANLTHAQTSVSTSNEPSPCDVVFEGDFDEVNRLIYEYGWSDGLPIVPPTRARMDAFLRFCDLPPDAELGILMPDNRRVTPWSVVVNGVMAGCRAQYMPILIALARAMANPRYGVEHSGNTPGAETLIVLNGPIIKQCGFNYQQGALRDGFQANTTVGRFWRLLMINGAGFRLHHNDKGTYGNTFRVVLAENEDVLANIGWEPLCSDRGVPAGENAVTIARFTGGNVVVSAYGHDAHSILPYLSDGLLKQHDWELVFTAGIANGTLCPMLVLSPLLAQTIAASGFSRHDVKRYLFDHARISAQRFERYIGKWTNMVPGRRSLGELVAQGKAPAVLAESDDPQRLVPIVSKPDDFMIAVTGDPLRTNAYAFAHNGMLGYPVSERIQLPQEGMNCDAPRLCDGVSDARRPLWLLTPSGRRASGDYIDDTLCQRAAERGMLGRLSRAGDFPRQRIEVLRSSNPSVEVSELYYRRGWTDGLPIIAPTLERVDEALEAVTINRNDVIAELDPLKGIALVEQVAANAVMAGCRPEHLPVVIAAVRAIAKPQFNLRGVQTTDENVAPVLIISGPCVRTLEVNDGFGALGPGWRGSASIGRAVRLVMNNIGGGWPGAVSVAGLGQPARYTLCFSEDEAHSPWPSLREEYGFTASDSVLTVLRAETVINVTGGLPEVASVMGSAASAFSMAYGGRVTVILSPHTAMDLARRGMTKCDVKQWLHVNGRVEPTKFESFWLKRETIDASRWPTWLTSTPHGAPLPIVEHADDITLVVAGGALPIAQHAYLPTWGFPACRIHELIE